MSSAPNSGERGRFSSQRETASVLRLLRGEDLELVSRELGVTAATLSEWRDDFLAGGQAALKSRPTDDRDAEIARLLYAGVSLVVLDVVTNRHGNLHNDIVDLMQRDSTFHFGREESPYAVGYRPVRRDSAEVVDMWPTELFLGQALPTLPLYLRGDVCVPIELDATYNDASRRLRLT
jgi:transposase